jgi:tetrahydrodipicolinate N-succinyltransferase
VTIGAGAIIGPGLELGAYAMIGMGAVVTADVPPHALVYGNPARVRGWVCVCGEPFPASPENHVGAPAACTRCGRPRSVVGAP